MLRTAFPGHLSLPGRDDTEQERVSKQPVPCKAAPLTHAGC